MKSYKFLSILLLISLLAGLAGTSQPAALAADQLALLAVTLKPADAIQRYASTGLPAYALLDGYILGAADSVGRAALASAGLSFQVLDAEMSSGYYHATRMPSAARFDWRQYGRLLLDLGDQAVVQTSPHRAEQLSLAGVELRYISLTPIVLPVDQSAEQIFPDVVDPDPIVQMVIDQVPQDTVLLYDRELAGELPVWVDGSWYTITTRYNYSGEPIRKATSYVGQRMAADGLDVEYHVWETSDNPNVIGEIAGLSTPDDIFIIGGHLDDVSGTPGADDNASGSVATMIAAELLSQYQWNCTVRFAFWTGEEQGLNGSAAYAARSDQLNENILGYLNLDMIAYNTIGSTPGIDLLYNSSMPPTLELAQLMSDVIAAYDLDLVPQLVTSLGGGSDHSSFWDHGYTAILGIEDQGDFNPYYHGPGDTPAHTDLAFFTQFVKASVATFMHMSGCYITGGTGNLDGHVTAADGGAPVPAATVEIADDAGHVFTVQTDASGYYTQTLLAGTYTVTASAYDYLPVTATGVTVVTDTVTTQDFSLPSAPHYTVSGTVTEAGTGLPLFAHVIFNGSPVETWTDPATGFYQASLPEGEYTMTVSADLHRSQSRPIVVDQDQTQNFALEPLPCILLVDDDNDAPDTTPYYTAALDALGFDYDIISVGGSPNGPDLATLQGYDMVLWYSGDIYGSDSAGPNSTDETNLTAYLNGGGKLFLDSQDYLYDMGLTSFGQNYLGVASFTSDSGNAATKYGVAGDPVGDGLGPYSLTYPSGFTDYGDIVNPGAGASIAFRSASGGGGNPLDIDKDGGDWQTVFFGTSWVPVYNNNAANGRQVLQRVIDFFGGCQSTDGQLEGTVTDSSSGEPLEGATVTVQPALKQIQAITDPNGYYSMTLPAGDYLVTAALEGYEPQTLPATVNISETTVLDFALQAEVLPPQIDITPSSISETLETGEFTVVNLTVANLGGSPLNFTITDQPPVTWLDFEPLSGKVDPSASQVVSVTLDTTELGAGVYTTTLEFASDDPLTPLVVVPVTLTVTPACVPVSADFAWSPEAPLSGEVVTFTAMVTGTEPFSYLWEFSDGITSTAESPARTFAPGVYTVTLTVSNDCGVDTVTYTITITPPARWLFLPLVSKH